MIAWTAVPNAVKYEVQLAAYTDMPNSTVTLFHTETVTESGFRQHRCDSRSQQSPHKLPVGSTIGLRITAFDASGKRIAISTEDRRFLVALPL